MPGCPQVWHMRTRSNTCIRFGGDRLYAELHWERAWVLQPGHDVDMQLAGLYKSVYMKHCIKKGTPFHSIHYVFYFRWDITNQNGQFRRFIHHSHPFPMLFFTSWRCFGSGEAHGDQCGLSICWTRDARSILACCEGVDPKTWGDTFWNGAFRKVMVPQIIQSSWMTNGRSSIQLGEFPATITGGHPIDWLKSVCFKKKRIGLGDSCRHLADQFYPSSVRSQVWVISMLMNRRQAQSIIVSFFFRFPARCDNDAGLTSFDMYQWNIWNAVQLVATCGLFDPFWSTCLEAPTLPSLYLSMSRISSIPMHQTSPKSWQWLQWIRSIGLRIRSLGSNGPMTSSAPAAYLERWADFFILQHSKLSRWSISYSMLFRNLPTGGFSGIHRDAIDTISVFLYPGYPRIGPTHGPFGQKKIPLGGCKVGGILARAVPFNGRLEGIIVGIGINVNTSKEELDRMLGPFFGYSVLI